MADTADTEGGEGTAEDHRFEGKSVYWATYSIRDWWVECSGHRHQARNNGLLVRPLCQLLVAAGHPDGVLRFRNADDDKPTMWIWSIHATAAGPRPMYDETDDSIEASEGAEATVEAAPKATGGKANGRARHYKAPAPAENKFLHVNVAGQRVRVNPKHREAFCILAEKPDTWDTAVHAKTRNYLMGVHWVIVDNGKPKLTDFGQQVANAAAQALDSEAG